MSSRTRLRGRRVAIAANGCSPRLHQPAERSFRRVRHCSHAQTLHDNVIPFNPAEPRKPWDAAAAAAGAQFGPASKLHLSSALIFLLLLLLPLPLPTLPLSLAAPSSLAIFVPTFLNSARTNTFRVWYALRNPTVFHGYNYLGGKRRGDEK